MEKITKIEDLKQGDELVSFDGEKVMFYTFLMVHPNNENYVLLIDALSKNAFKYYIPNIIDKNGSWYRDYKIRDVLEYQMEYYKKQLKFLEERIKNETL